MIKKIYVVEFGQCTSTQGFKNVNLLLHIAWHVNVQIFTLWWFSNRAVSIRNSIQTNDKFILFDTIKQPSERKEENCANYARRQISQLQTSAF